MNTGEKVNILFNKLGNSIDIPKPEKKNWWSLPSSPGKLTINEADDDQTMIVVFDDGGLTTPLIRVDFSKSTGEFKYAAKTAVTWWAVDDKEEAQAILNKITAYINRSYDHYVHD